MGNSCVGTVLGLSTFMAFCFTGINVISLLLLVATVIFVILEIRREMTDSKRARETCEYMATHNPDGSLRHGYGR
jgi:4-hydroxybenzoate polyprenyltransferase